MKSELQPEHHWLQKLVGEWTYEHEMAMEPGGPLHKFTGSETVRTLGGFWVLCEGRGEMPGGGEAVTVMTLGYDPAKKRYVGTFIGSMMSYLWLYDGELDAAANKLTLNAEGPSFAGDGGMAQYQDAIEFKTDDYRLLTSHVQGADGQWTPFMTAHYRRK